jgi:hypothetical protein
VVLRPTEDLAEGQAVHAIETQDALAKPNR